MCLTSIFSELVRIYPLIFTSDLLRYVIGAGGVYLVVNILFVRWLENRKIRDKNPPKGQIPNEMIASLRSVAVFAAVGTMIYFGKQAGLFDIYDDIAQYGWWYFAFSIGVAIVGQDAWFYWSHRIMHYPPLFRYFHRVHHRSHNPTAFSSYSFDASEALVHAIYLPLMLLVLPIHPLALFIFLTHMILRNAIGHSGYELFPANVDGRPLIGWLTTVTHHDLHHAHGGYNMGLYFSWWDRWMGTEHPEYHAEFLKISNRARGIDQPA